MKNLKVIIRPSIILAIITLCTVFCQAQSVVPIPVRICGGGRVPDNVPLAFYLSLTVILVMCMFIRFLVIRKNHYFKKQSTLKNFFYELNEYTSLKPELNFCSIGIIILNVIALFVLMVGFFLHILE